MKLLKKSIFALAVASVFSFGLMSCDHDTGSGIKEFPTEPSIPCPEGDGVEVVFSAATKKNEGSISKAASYKNGEVSYTTTALYSGGGITYYVKPDQSVINLENYDSVYVDFEYEANDWAKDAEKPQWCLNIFGEDDGFYSPTKAITYFGDKQMYGRTSILYTLTEEDYFTIDSVCIKLNCYKTGNNDSDSCRVTLKKIKFLRKEGAGEDKPVDDGLTDDQRGTVKKITYTSKDYQANPSKSVTKPAYIYLPAGYNAEDTETKYPVLYLMHGIGGNESEWGMTDNKSRIKKYMDKEIAAGTVKPFIIVCPVGRSSSDYANCQTTDFSKDNVKSFYKFGSELRNDLITYMDSTYNTIKDRDGRAMAGLSMGGMQTINIGLCESLDIISWFGAFSAAPTSYTKEDVNSILAKDFADYNINYFYNICGTEDSIALNSHTAAAKGLDTICDKLTDGENYTWYTTSGGHGFDIWYPGFEAFAKIAFQSK